MLAASLAIAAPAAFGAIVFSNAGLEGTADQGGIPSGWSVVPLGASYSEASNSSTITGDTLTSTGPNVAAGMFGNPHSGSSFVAGMYGTSLGITGHEGLEQTVGGFTVGQQYSFSFFQTNVGITSRRDMEGSWRVYADGALVGTTIPTASPLAWDDPNKATGLVWEERTITFIATAESMTLSFMPYDSDGNITGAEGIYMGIDSFSEITPIPEPATALFGAFGLLGLIRRRR